MTACCTWSRAAIDSDQYAESARTRQRESAASRQTHPGLAGRHGELLWHKSDVDTRELLPTTLCVAEGRCFFQSPDHVICLDARSGESFGVSPRPLQVRRLGWSTPTLVVQDGVVLRADCAAADAVEETTSDQVEWTPRPAQTGNASLGELIALSAADGTELWRCPTAQGYNSPPDVFVADGLVWTSTVPNPHDRLHRGPRPAHRRSANGDRHDGAPYHHPPSPLLSKQGHRPVHPPGQDRDGVHRPGRRDAAATLLGPGRVPVRRDAGNGLLYAPPHSCACYIQSKLSGFWALAPSGKKTDAGSPASGRGRLEEGRLRGCAGAFVLPPSRF